MRFANFLVYQIAPSERASKRPMMAFRFIGDPVNTFNRVSRAVYLAAALALRIGDEIWALRAGKPLGPAALAPQADVTAKRLADEVRDIGLEALVEEVETAARPEKLVDDLHELRREARMEAEFHRLLNGPLKDAVAAICADLGLKPDWSLWTEDGFPPPPGGREVDWIAFFLPEGGVDSTPVDAGREPARPPPRRDAHRAWDKTWRPPWPAPEPHDPHPGATRPPDRARSP